MSTPAKCIGMEIIKNTLSHSKTLTVAISILLSVFCTFARATENTPIGTRIESFRFKDIRSLPRNLSDLGQKKAYVFVFTTTQCPIVKKLFPKLKQLYKDYRDKDVVLVSVNVGPSDTIRDIAAQAIEFDAPFYFVKDYDLSVAQSLGVSRTPECVILDEQHQIRYRGRFDDQLRLGGTKPTVGRADLQSALDEVLAGKLVTVPETTVDGCVISKPSTPSPDTATTFYQDILPITQTKCAGCHRENAATPFALQTLDDINSNIEMIREVVRDQTMPPWYANSQYGVFQNDCSLSKAESDKILAWIDSPRALGDPQDAPSSPQFVDNKWRIGTPDLVITMLEQHTIPETGFVPYKYVLLPHVFFNETWVEAFEIRPENPAVVHHCNMAYATSAGASDETFITGYVPGGQPMDLGRFNNNVAYKIPAGSALGLQVHYTTTGKKEKCRIQVGLRFPKKTIKKQLYHFVLDPRGWTIPPHDPAFKIEASKTLKRNADLLGLFTHMHVRGRDMTFYANGPNDQSEILLQIPNYNFEWQLGYEIAPSTKLLPKGTQVKAIAHFDNSDFNPYNPDPEKGVGYGPQTVDEMFNGYVFYVDRDENLSIEVDPKNGRLK
jgi:thiol-disulfide isomerase/thioredoxin